ncbi:unnamed protein product [Allacma fusca]|uniref:EamA domain-containing protein n=1 Tax=Allacma fusca TaxID=39272 RepID=A0A8J2KIX6_9HEXA|nr:unnamed protein product [Allacma fusca]
MLTLERLSTGPLFKADVKPDKTWVIKALGMDREKPIDIPRISPEHFNFKEKARIQGGENDHSGKSEKKGWKRFGGIIFGLSASFFFSLTIVMVKTLKNYHPFGLSPCLFAGTAFPAIPILFYYQFRGNSKVNVFETVWPLEKRAKRIILLMLMIRAILGSTSVFLRFYSLKYMSIADSSVISHSSPVFVVIIAHFTLKEKCGFVPLFVALVTCFGVFVIFRPPILTGSESFDSETLTGSILASCAMLINAFMFIVMRKLRQVHFTLMLVSFGLWGLAESLIIGGSMGVLQLPSNLQELLLTFGVMPATVFMGQISLVLALKFENAGPVSLLRTCDVVLSFLWQYIFLNVIPDGCSLVGAVIVILGVVVTALRKWVSTLGPEDSHRKKLSFFLLYHTGLGTFSSHVEVRSSARKIKNHRTIKSEEPVTEY